MRQSSIIGHLLIATAAAFGILCPATHTWAAAHKFTASQPTKSGQMEFDVDGETFTVSISKDDTPEEKAAKIRNASVAAGIPAYGTGKDAVWKNYKCVKFTDGTGQSDPWGWIEDDSSVAQELEQARFALPTTGQATGLTEDSLTSTVVFGLSMSAGTNNLDIGLELHPTTGTTALSILNDMAAQFTSAGFTTGWSTYDFNGVEFTALTIGIHPSVGGPGGYYTAIWGSDDAGLDYGGGWCGIPEPTAATIITAGSLILMSRRRIW